VEGVTALVGEVLIYSAASIPRLSVEHAIESHPPCRRDDRDRGWIVGRPGHECLVRVVDPTAVRGRPKISAVKRKLTKGALIPSRIRTVVSVYRETSIDGSVEDVASPLHTTAEQTARNLAEKIGAAFRGWGVVVLQDVDQDVMWRIRPHEQV